MVENHQGQGAVKDFGKDLYPAMGHNKLINNKMVETGDISKQMGIT